MSGSAASEAGNSQREHSSRLENVDGGAGAAWPAGYCSPKEQGPERVDGSALWLQEEVRTAQQQEPRPGA